MIFVIPGVALLAINAMATDQLNGSFPTITCLVNNTGSIKPKNNPAWACYDLLKREGIPDSDINMTKFQEWADYCTQKGLTVGLYLDSSTRTSISFKYGVIIRSGDCIAVWKYIYSNC